MFLWWRKKKAPATDVEAGTGLAPIAAAQDTLSETQRPILLKDGWAAATPSAPIVIDPPVGAEAAAPVNAGTAPSLPSASVTAGMSVVLWSGKRRRPGEIIRVGTAGRRVVVAIEGARQTIACSRRPDGQYLLEGAPSARVSHLEILADGPRIRTSI